MTDLAESRPLVVFGAAGFVGRHLRGTLASWPGGVTVVTRRAVDISPGESRVSGDLASPEQLAARLPDGAIVVNLAYDTAGGHEANLSLADGLVHVCEALRAVRLVHVSTAMVVGMATEQPVTEATTCHPVTPYQRTKLAVEARLHARLSDACPLVVLRPTAVFGSGGLNLRKLARQLRGAPAYRNYLRSSLFGGRPMNLVPVETVAAAVRFAAVSDRAVSDGCYLVADDDAPSNNFRDVESVMRDAFGLGPYRPHPLRLPSALLPMVLRAANRLSFDPRTTFSSARLERTGFVRPLTFPDALAAYAAALADEPSPGAAT